MSTNLFEFESYKTYLLALAGPKSQRRGLKSAMAGALQCQPTYISQVFNGNSHLSLEQADKLNTFLSHPPEESHYFLLLVQRDRSGTLSLKKYFDEQIRNIQNNRLILTERLGENHRLSIERQAQYYSSWQYAAIHIGLTVPQLRTPKEIAAFFRLPQKKVNEVLVFLVETSLANRDAQGQYSVGQAKIRLGNDSPNILRHHANWRQQAIDSLDNETLEDLHYSGVISLSRQDALRIKDRLLERLKEDLKLIHASPEETLYVYCLDFFSFRR